MTTLTTPPPPPAPRPLAALAPVAEGERLVLLDVLRGFALFGIFMVNMPLFAETMMRGFGNIGMPERSTVDKACWFIATVFFQFKFISLFSLLFGAGFAMQLLRAQARGRSVVAPYLRRSFALLVIGLIHALLIWYGDILVVYALGGLLLLPLGRLPVRWLLGLAAATILFGALLTSGLGIAQVVLMEQAATWPTEPVVLDESAPAAWNAMVEAQFNPADPRWEAAETAAYRDGPFLHALLFRVWLWFFALVSAPFSYGWYVLGMFMLGAAFMKSGFFLPSAAKWHRRLAVLVVPGLALEALLAWVHVRENWEFTMLNVGIGGLHMISSALVMLGYLGLMCLLVHARPAAALWRIVGNLGRMGLTGYIGESVLTTAVMYWWGLGYFGSVGRPAQIGLVVAIWLALVVFANLWFRAFRMGPLEWLWRTATYLKPPPLLRQSMA